MSAIGSPGFVPRAHRPSGSEQQSVRLDAEPTLDQQMEAEPVLQQQDAQEEFSGTREEIADVLAQFARRLGDNRKARRSEDHERILDEQSDEKLDDLHQFMTASKVKSGELLREARRRFGDDSDLMLALRELRRRRRIEGEPVDALDEAIEELAREADPKMLKAGINVALKAKVFGKGMQLNPGLLRQLYRQFLLFEGSYLMIYESWIEEYGLKRRKRILEYTHAALTYDMQSLDPSCGGAAEFGPLLGMLGNVRALSSADEQFVARLLRNGMMCDAGMTEACAITMLLEALQRPLSVGSTLGELVAPLLAPLAFRQRSEFMQLVLRALAGVPITLFDDPEERHLLIAFVQEMLSMLYEQERKAARLGMHAQPMQGYETPDAERANDSGAKADK